MGSSHSQFSLPDRNKVFHSSGVVNATSQGDTLGSSSTETFAERQQIDRNRRHVQKYGDAHVVHNYRAQAVQSGALATSRVSEADSADPAHRHKRQRSSQVPPRIAQIVRERPTSRIDIVRPLQTSPQRSQGKQGPAFREPPSRGFHPYQ